MITEIITNYINGVMGLHKIKEMQEKPDFATIQGINKFGNGCHQEEIVLNSENTCILSTKSPRFFGLFGKYSVRIFEYSQDKQISKRMFSGLYAGKAHNFLKNRAKER